MTLNIRRLDPVTDRAVHLWAWRWLLDSPSWRRHAEAVFGTLDREEYLAALTDERRLDIGIWDGPLFIAKVVLHLTAKHTYEVSLEADRRANPATIITAGRLIHGQLFGNYGAECVYAWMPRWARGVQTILTAIGFSADHVTMARGTARRRLIEWDRYSLRRANEQ
jgi:hypothetical protein